MDESAALPEMQQAGRPHGVIDEISVGTKAENSFLIRGALYRTWISHVRGDSHGFTLP